MERKNQLGTAVVTGANAGLGLEAAAQLAEAGYKRVVVAARTEAKAQAAAKTLNERVGRDVFAPLVLDLDDLSSAAAAGRSVVEQFGPLDALILNAGVPGMPELARTADGFEATVAATLIGHHVFTMSLLEAGAIARDARIVIAGSEAARNQLPTYPIFSTHDVHQVAKSSYDGDLGQALEAIIRMEPPLDYKPNRQYASTKMFASWWVAELAGHLPAGATVNAVSPGNTAGTSIADKLPALMRRVMMPMMAVIPGLSHPVEDGASRYLEAIAMGSDVTGQSFASRPRRMTGPIAQLGMPHLHDHEAQVALWNVLERITGRANGVPKTPSVSAV